MFVYREQALPGVWVGFTDVAAGNLAARPDDDDLAEVAANRAALQEQLGPDAGPLRFVRQVHGVDVHDVSVRPDGNSADSPATADAQLDPTGRASLAVLSADCVPIVFVGTRGSQHEADVVTAVAHAGRQGAADGVALRTVEAMRSAGAQHVRAWLGPAVCGGCYEVPEGMQRDVEATLPGSATSSAAGTPALDIRAGLRRQLAERDVETSVIDLCTREDQRLFSYRRDQTRGRFAGLVWRGA